MSHVHWWLVGLSFLMGLVLTFALIIRSAKGPSVVGASAGAAAAGAPEPPIGIPTTIEWPTTPIADAVEALTARVPVAGESLTRGASVAEQPPAPVAEEPVTTEFPVAEGSPWAGRPVAQAPPVKEAPPEKAPPAKTGPLTKASPAKAPPVEKARHAKAPPAKRRPKLPYAPYGPGSARATPDGGGPSGWLVKGRSDTRLYYTPDDPAYHLTVAQVWFKDEASAMRACFTPWSKSSRRK